MKELFIGIGPSVAFVAACVGLLLGGTIWYHSPRPGVGYRIETTVGGKKEVWFSEGRPYASEERVWFTDRESGLRVDVVGEATVTEISTQD